jgi:hypothetical protein
MIFLAPKKIAQQSLQQLADHCTQETSAYRGEEALGDRDIAFRCKKEQAAPSQPIKIKEIGGG